MPDPMTTQSVRRRLLASRPLSRLMRRRRMAVLGAGALVGLLLVPVAYASLTGAWRQIATPARATPLDAAREALRRGRYADAETQLTTLAAADPAGDAAL